MTTPIEQIIFDFDGVILDSATLKTSAFAAVYAEEDAANIGAIVEYQEANGGISRAEKFRYFERELFGRAGDEATVARLCQRFAETIESSMAEAVFIRGARALLDHCAGAIRMHVVSGMPEVELRQIVETRGLSGYFDRLHGAPMGKLEAFRCILAATGVAPSRTLAIGDSLTEFAAARELGMPFLAVVPAGNRNRFPAMVPVVTDLTNAACYLG